jgi:hypothetical protein
MSDRVDRVIAKVRAIHAKVVPSPTPVEFNEN